MAAPKKTERPAAAGKAESAALQAEVNRPADAPAEEKKAQAPKAAEKKSAEKKAGTRKPTMKKADQKATLHIQFSGKSYSQEELVKMAQDVWRYDLKQKVRALADIELYVKPEENMVYYVMNQEFTGSFYI